MKKTIKMIGAAFLGAAITIAPAHAEDTRIALVVKALGIGFFEAAAKGAEEAAAELGGVEVIYKLTTFSPAVGETKVPVPHTDLRVHAKPRPATAHEALEQT